MKLALFWGLYVNSVQEFLLQNAVQKLTDLCNAAMK